MEPSELEALEELTRSRKEFGAWYKRAAIVYGVLALIQIYCRFTTKL